MKLLRLPERRKGIALIIVMFIVVVFAMMAAGLAYTMKVETKLARNSSWETELYWMGFSGVERAKAFVQKSGQQGYHSLNQLWAGGIGETNAALEGLTLKDIEIGHGRMSIEIIDCERKLNINAAAMRPELLQQAFILMGIDVGEAPNLSAAITDWIDPDDNTSTDSESKFYEALVPPLRAKNGPIDDLSEMMWIKGVSPQMFYGTRNTDQTHASLRRMRSANSENPMEEVTYPLGFVDLFTALGGPQINLNTADANVLQLHPEISADIAQEIIRFRAGPDGVDGNEDDNPFKSPGELANIVGMGGGGGGGGNPRAGAAAGAAVASIFGVRSSIFEVRVKCEIDKYQRTFHAFVRPMNQNQSVTLYTWWE